MRFIATSEPGDPGSPNEDWAGIGPGLAVLLDGATARIGTGCEHGVAWYAQRLGQVLLAGVSDRDRGLTEALADSIETVAALHPQCDLEHPGTPSAAVAIVRVSTARVEYLVLADTVVALRAGAEISVVTDDRIAGAAAAERASAMALPVGTVEREEALRRAKAAEQRARNRPGGFWVAAADPSAAAHALTGDISVVGIDSVALFTDGAARCVEPFALLDWPQVFVVLDREGPDGLLREVRSAEEADPNGVRWPRTKRSDDATVIYGRAV